MSKRDPRKKAMPVSKNPTMTDVARIADVSQMTVSRVMRKSGYVSSVVMERVYKAAETVGYVHNRLAGGLAGGDSSLVGVVLPTLQNRVFSEVLSGVTSALGDIQVQPVFGVSEYSEEVESALVLDLLAWRPKGLIISGLEHSASLRETLLASSITVAEIMDIDGSPIESCFGFSHRKAGLEMARHLLEKGYRRFAYIGSQPDKDLRAKKRFTSFKNTIRKQGARVVAEISSDEPTSMLLGRHCTDQILRGGHKPDVIYYANDDLAAGGLMHCLAQQIRVPDDLALAGFNGLSFLESLPQQITTTRTPRFKIGTVAARFVSGQMPETDNAPKHDLGVELLAGETS